MAVIGGGPAGLMAAEVLAGAGAAVSVRLFDAMPSVGRKFLLAGRGGLNLTHSEPPEVFMRRYGEHSAPLQALIAAFGPVQVRAWADALGVETFVGSSGLVFPRDMKAAPLLRAWLHRLRGAGVQFSMRHRWLGWAEDGDDQGALKFSTPAGEVLAHADAVVLALGGGSWARLGSDGAWVPLLAGRGVAVAPLLPANCGFDVALPGAHTPPPGVLPVQAVPARAVGWSDFFRERFAGQPFKNVAIRCTNAAGHHFERKGEFVATDTGVEGSLIYAASSLLRDDIIRSGHAMLQLDLLPDLPAERVAREIAHPRGSRSLANHLKGRLGLDGIKLALLHEVLGKEAMNDPAKLAPAVKALPLQLVAARPIDEAISTAGGVLFEALDADLMCEALPGVYCAGEMLDWEAPTGGYLLTACLASGHRAGAAVLRHLRAAQH